jgi:hypothetical protein
MKVYGDEDLQKYIKDIYNSFQNQTFQLTTQIHKNAIVFPYQCRFKESASYGGVFDENNNLIEISKDSYSAVGYPQKLAIPSYKTVDNEVIYLGYLSYHFGHFLVDSLSRFWFLLDSLDKTKDLVYISNKDNLFISDILNFVGWGRGARKVYRIKEPIKFKSVTIPQSSCFYDHYHIEYKDSCRKIAERVEDNKIYKKIYVSRRKLKSDTTSKLYGDQYFEKAFKKAGFKIIYPEKLSLKEQIGLMKNCEHLAGIVGSALHLSLFCKDGIEVTHILRCKENIRRYIRLNKAKNIKDNYICAYAEPLPVGSGGFPFIVNINDKNFIDYINDNNMEIKKRPEFCLTTKEFIRFIADWSVAIRRHQDEIVEDVPKYVSLETLKAIVSIVNVEDLRRQTRPLRNLVFRIFKAKILFLTNFIPSKNKRKIVRNQTLNWIHLKLFHMTYY